MIELLVSISIISILIGLLLPAVQAAREASRRTQCATNLQQMGLALQMYHGAHRAFPPGIRIDFDFESDTGVIPQDAMFWSGAILPFIEQSAIYDKLSLQKEFSEESNADLFRIPLPIFRCPSAVIPRNFTHGISRRAGSTYLGCTSGTENREAGPASPLFWNVQNGIFFVNSEIKHAHIKDGSSSTVMVGETLCAAIAVQPDTSGISQLVDHWMIGTMTFAKNEMSEALGSTAAPMGVSMDRDPSMYPDDQELSYSSRHWGGAQFVFADGHVTMLSESIDPIVYSALGTCDEQEIIENDSY